VIGHACLKDTPMQTDLPDRLPQIPREAMTEAQRTAVDELVSGPRGGLIGPFVPLLRSPELMRRLQKVGEYLRYENSVGLHISEFAVLVVARHWSQPVEWHIHRPIALKAGVREDTCEAIAQGRRPPHLNAQETVAYDFLQELLHHQSVSDPTWAAALQMFGEQGVIDMTAHCGYYSLLAMVMNASRTSLPDQAAPGIAPFPR
jgi:4-carboxymuconolactone decarboxylase